MSATWQSILFLVGFSCLWFVFLLLDNTFASWYVLGAVVLFLGSYWRRVDWSRFSNYPVLAGGWLFFLGGALVSSLFSINIPLSLTAWVGLSFSWLVFWFFLLSDKKLISVAEVVGCLLLIGIVLCLISLVFYWLPAYAQLLPDMNLVYPTYGHNHLAAYLLIVLPLAWYLALSPQLVIKTASFGQLSLPSSFFLGLGIFFSIFLFFSFGRVALVIGCLETLLVVNWIFRQAHMAQRRLGQLISGFLISLVVVSFLINVVAIVAPANQWCQSLWFAQRICKPVTKELRGAYWSQAIAAMVDRPLTGYGLGTFSLINFVYRPNIYLNSAYAHNSFFQYFAETGVIIGGIFTGLMVLVLVWAWKSLPAGPPTLTHISLISVVALYVNAWFDFDWSFTSLFALTWLLLAMVLRQGNFSPAGNKLPSWLTVGLARVSQLLTAIMSVVILSLSALFAVTNVLINQGQPERAFQLFPYFSWHWRVWAEELPAEQRAKASEIYWHHPPALQALITNETDWTQKTKLTQALLVADPLSYLYQSNVLAYLEQQKLSEAMSDFYHRYQVITRVYAYDPSSVNFAHWQSLSDEAVVLSRELSSHSGYEQAAQEVYLLAYHQDPWILSRYYPFFVSPEYSTTTQVAFLNALLPVEPQYIGPFGADFVRAIEAGIATHLVDPQLSLKLADWIPQLARLDQGHLADLWQTKTAAAFERIDQAQSEGDLQTAHILTQRLVALQAELTAVQYPITFNQKQQLASLLMEVGNMHLAQDMSVVVHNYRQANNLVPWGMENNVWLKTTDPRLLDAPELRVFADAAIQDGWPMSGMEDNFEKLFQLSANQAVSQGDWPAAEQYLLALAAVGPTRYWPAVQVGNYYLWRGDFDQAAQVFEKCLQEFQNRHPDCQQGWELSQSQQVTDEPFYKASHQILKY